MRVLAIIYCEVSSGLQGYLKWAGAALQSDKVYPPRLSPLPTTGIAVQRINAIR
jgi:hypothetical protein